MRDRSDIRLWVAVGRCAAERYDKGCGRAGRRETVFRGMVRKRVLAVSRSVNAEAIRQGQGGIISGSMVGASQEMMVVAVGARIFGG